MRDRLFINEEEIDLAPDTVITYTSQLNDIGEVKNQKSNLTNQFKVPKTNHNRTVLESAELIQSETLLPYRKTPAVIKKNGVQIIPKGFAVIESADKFYNVVVYSGNIDLFDRLGDKLLSDLDLSAFDHTFDFATAVGSRTNVYTGGYKYPVIDYGKMWQEERTVKVYNLRPATFVLMLLNKIFEEAELSIIYSDLVEEKLELLLFPFVNNDIALDQSTIDALTYEVETAGSPDYTYNVLMQYTGFTSFPTVGTDTRVVPLDTIVSDAGNNWDIILYEAVVDEASRQKFTATGTINISVNSPAGANIHSQGFVHYTLGVYRNNILIAQTNQTSAGYAGATFNVNLITPVFIFSQGDIVTVKLFTKAEVNFKKTVSGNPFITMTDPADYDVTIYGGFNFSNEVIPATTYGSPISLSNTLPKMKQADFVKAYLQMTCGILKTDSISGIVYWNSFQDIANNKDNAEDWTDKLDMKSERQTAYRYGNYSRINRMLYKTDTNDTDMLPEWEDAGAGAIEIDDEVLPKEGTIIELPFSPTRMVKRLLDLDVPLIRKIIDVSGDEFTRAAEPRVLIDDTQDLADITVPEITFEDEDGNSLVTAASIPLCYFIVHGKEFNLGFNNSLIEIFFDGLRTSLQKAKIKNEGFKLDSVDIMGLDHFKPKWLQQFGAYFYLSKVSQWKNGETITKCEIIRL